MNRTFGIEIEAYDLPLSEVARAITAAGVTCRVEGYTHSTPENWKVVTDASISGRNGFEVVSPILRGTEGLEEVRKVMDALTAAGAKVNRSTGLHVHIGAADFTVAEVRNMAKNYVIFEDFFDAIMPPSRRASANMYIKSNRNQFGGYDKAATRRAVEALSHCHTVDEVIRTACGDGRYYKLNLTAFWRHRTIEFRQHSGTTDADKAINWICLLMQFVNRAAVTRQRVTDRETTQSELFHAFFRAFRINGDLKPYFAARRKTLHPEEVGASPRESNTMRLARARRGR
jgi:hypothetical protein